MNKFNDVADENTNNGSTADITQTDTEKNSAEGNIAKEFSSDGGEKNEGGKQEGKNESAEKKKSHFLHYLKSCSSGLAVGVVLLAVSLLPNKFGGKLGLKLSEGFFGHYSEFPSVLIICGVLLLSISVFLEQGLAKLIRKWVARPIFEFLHHAISISAGMLPCLLVVEIASKGNSSEIWAMFIFLEIALFFFAFLLDTLIFAIDHVEKEYIKYSEKFKTSDDFKKAVKVLLLVTAALFIALCYWDFQRVVDISGDDAAHTELNCAKSH